MYAKIQYELCLYIKIQTTDVGVSLTDNHHLRAILMIHRFTSRCQGPSYTLSGV